MLFQADAVARILVVGRENDHLLKILVDPSLIEIDGTASFVQAARAVDKAEEAVLPVHFHEVLIASAIQEFFRMADVEGIADLSAGDGKGAEGRSFATEFDDRLFAFHDALQDLPHFGEANIAIHRLEALHERQVGLGNQILGSPRRSALIVIAIVVNGMAGPRQRGLLSQFDCSAAKVFRVFIAVIAHIDGRRLA